MLPKCATAGTPSKCTAAGPLEAKWSLAGRQQQQVDRARHAGRRAESQQARMHQVQRMPVKNTTVFGAGGWPTSGHWWASPQHTRGQDCAHAAPGLQHANHNRCTTGLALSSHVLLAPPPDLVAARTARCIVPTALQLCQAPRARDRQPCGGGSMCRVRRHVPARPPHDTPLEWNRPRLQPHASTDTLRAPAPLRRRVANRLQPPTLGARKHHPRPHPHTHDTRPQPS
jgi:hypothetical protein